ncbi:acyltransferase [Luteimonas aquatica]|uniref:acyltransferase n=1 Tax=Luteimonas aquatica TaxID=450364 RepID=UPI001F5AD7E6|nr:acyltransferase [Luteimonas aquatica]
MTRMSKVCYVVARTLSVFGLPGLRGLRGRVYRWHFAAPGMSVSDRVMVVAAHRSATASIAFAQGVELGADSYIDYSGGVRVGAHVAISEGARIFTHNHVVRRGHSNWHRNPIEFSPLQIEDEAWIGAGAIVLPRVRRIGRGAIVGAGAVLGEDVPDHAVYAGNPARLVYMRDVDAPRA